MKTLSEFMNGECHLDEKGPPLTGLKVRVASGQFKGQSGIVVGDDQADSLEVELDNGRKVMIDIADVELNEALEEALEESIKTELKAAVKGDETVEIELEDGDTIDVDPETAKDILASGKVNKLMKSAKDRDSFLKFLDEVL